MCRRESVSSQHEEGLELNPLGCGSIFRATRNVWLRAQTWAPCRRCFRGKDNSDDLLDTVDRVEERIRKQLYVDATF